METWYDEEADILNLELREGVYWKSVELPNGIVFDISKDGTILAVEVQRASKTFSKNKQIIKKLQSN